MTRGVGPPVPLAPRHEIRRVVVRCPNWLGDTVMAIPALRGLRAALPRAELVAVGPWLRPLIGDEEPPLVACPDWPASRGERLRLARRLGQAGVDLALILPNSIETALWARVCGARWRIGYAGDGRTPLLTHAVVPPTDPVHQVDQYLRLLAPLGVTDVPRVPRLGVAAGRLAEARRLLADVRLRPADRPVGIALGAALGPAKLWPARRYGELAGRLEGHGIPTVFLGTGAARPLLEEIVAARPEAPRSLVGRDGPDLLPALLHEVALLIGADSGPVHLAAAVGTPVLTLFGPTDPRLTAPRGAPGEALWRQPACGPCFLARCPIDHRCLEALEVEEVLSAALRLHGGAP